MRAYLYDALIAFTGLVSIGNSLLVSIESFTLVPIEPFVLEFGLLNLFAARVSLFGFSIETGFIANPSRTLVYSDYWIVDSSLHSS